MKLGPRGQAVIVLALVATLGALAGVLGERIVAQQRAGALEATAPRPFRGPPGMMGRGPLASDATTRAPGQRGANGMMRAPAAAEVRYAERLSTMIELTAEQQVAIDSIVTEERRRVSELTAQLEPRFRQIAQETRQRVEAVLTPEQREQMRTMRQQRMRMLTEPGPRRQP
jgi:Spy/CpxP family protein refolding chaperone